MALIYESKAMCPCIIIKKDICSVVEVRLIVVVVVVIYSSYRCRRRRRRRLFIYPAPL